MLNVNNMAYNSKWSDLPPELLDEVVSHLEIPSDSWHLRSVCSTWRSALPPRVFPDSLLPTDHLIMFQPTSNFNDDDDVSSANHHRRRQGCHVRLAKHTFFHISLPQSKMPATQTSSAGWLMKTEEHRPGVFHLFSPFSRTCMENMLTKHISSGNKLDLTNVRIRELGYEYVLHNVHDKPNKDQDLHNMDHQKVALIGTNNSHAILSTHDTGKLLLYWSQLKEWSFLDHFTQLGYDDRSLFVNDWSLHYVDVVEYKGLFYAVTNSGRTVSIKVAPDGEVMVTLLTKSIIGGDKKCLVKLSDDLLMVDLYTCPTPGTESLKVHAVDVFRLDMQQGRWVLMKDLDDHALFLSNHSCFSISTSTLPGCKSSCIYFHFKSYADKEFCRGKHNNDDIDIGDHDDDDDDKFIWSTKDVIGVFDFERGINGSLGDYLEDLDLFSWPPPSWISWEL